jgi:hypothetical protein
MCAETKGDRATQRLTRGYVYLCYAGTDDNGAKTVSLARFGHYDVRLVEFVPTNPTDPTPMWLELYSHETQCAIDSCRCYDLEAAAQATEGLISQAKKLDDASRGMTRKENAEPATGSRAGVADGAGQRDKP